MTNDSMTMTYSAIVTGKDNRKIVRVLFERKAPGGSEVAEGLLPDCRIASSNGYSDEEIAGLEQYMRANVDDIMSRAKVISNPLKWFE